MNEGAKADLAELLAGFDRQMVTIARIQQARAQIIGRAAVRGKRVRVAVNVEGVVIETTFGADIDDLEYAEIAAAMTAAAQQAAADAKRQEQQLLAPLLEQQARMPKLHEMLDEIPDLSDRIPAHPAVSTAAPRARQQPVFDSDAPSFTDVEEYQPPRNRGAIDTGW